MRMRQRSLSNCWHDYNSRKLKAMHAFGTLLFALVCTRCVASRGYGVQKKYSAVSANKPYQLLTVKVWALHMAVVSFRFDVKTALLTSNNWTTRAHGLVCKRRLDMSGVIRALRLTITPSTSTTNSARQRNRYVLDWTTSGDMKDGNTHVCRLFKSFLCICVAFDFFFLKNVWQ